LRFDSLGDDEARAALRACCGATRWVDAMMGRRPFGTRERLLECAREIWNGLDEHDLREAFSHHPQIGDRESLRARFGAGGALAQEEQAGVAGASDEVLEALAEGNRVYAQKFGYIFIVSATGRSAAGMLETLRARLPNPPEREIRIAAGEQAKITELRLRALAEDQDPDG
jgi:2-oxo-4-hydroxy-4-carboxy-5-ureidoimidazoline decarboxylase